MAFFDDHVLASQPNFIWKPWFGLGIWDLGPLGHCLPTRFSCGFHMDCAWFAHVPHMVFMWFPHGPHMVSCAFHMFCTWFAHGLHMVCTCPPPGFHVFSKWFAHGLHMVFFTCFFTWFLCLPMSPTMFFMWFPHGPHMVFMWFPHGLHMVGHVPTWFFPHMVCMWFPHGPHMVSCAVHMVCTCPPPGFHVFSKWFAHGLRMVFSYGFSHACPYPPQCFLCGFHMAPTGFYVVSIWFAHGLHNLGMDGMDWLDGWDGKHVNYAGVKYIFVTNNISPATWHSLMTMSWYSSGSSGLILGFRIWDHQDTALIWFSCTHGLHMDCTQFAHVPHMVVMWFPYDFHPTHPIHHIHCNPSIHPKILIGIWTKQILVDLHEFKQNMQILQVYYVFQ